MKIHQGVNYSLLLYLLSFSFFASLYSQDLLMQNGTVNTCTGNFYDSSGPNGNYGTNEDFIFTICPDIPDYKLLVEFIEFQVFTSGGADVLTIYDGQDTTADVLAVLDQNDNISSGDISLNFVASANNLSGCLTFRFISDSFFNSSGWSAVLSCIEECQETTASVSQVVPSFFDTSTSNYQVSIFEDINIEIDPIFTDNNGNSPLYIWDFGDGTTPVTSNIPEISHIFENFGVYTVTVSITDDFGCTNNNVLQIPIEVVTPSGSLCSEARKICLDNFSTTKLNFNENNGGLPLAETGPDYGCLGSRPYPSWFYFQVENSGDIAFSLEQNDLEDFSGVGLDIDFKIWGPFTNAFGNCDNLNSGTEVPDLPNGDLFDGCSFSANNVENMGIQNAQAGEYYIFVTTNFSQDQGFIRISQINSSDPNAGSVSCDDTEFLGDDISACSSDMVTITSSIDSADSYQWEIFDPLSSSFQVIANEQNSTLVVNEPGGTFRCTVTTGASVVQDEITVSYFEDPILTFPAFDIIGCTDSSSTTVSLSFLNLQTLGVVNAANFELFYFENLSDANNGDTTLALEQSQIDNYPVTLSPTTLFIRIQNISNPICYTVVSFNAMGSNSPNVSPQPDLILCDDGDDGFEQFDLSATIPNIVGGLQNVTVSFFETENDANSNSNQISNITSYGNITNPQTIYFRVTESGNSCITVDSFDIVADDCLNVIDFSGKDDFLIYPIPSYDKTIYIKSNRLASANYNIKIADLSGRIVFAKTMTLDSNGEGSLNLNALSSGIYLSIIEVGSSSIAKKIVLE